MSAALTLCTMSAETRRRQAPPACRVLIVEDNADGAESLRLLLELLGYEATVAHDGPAGVRTARTWRPDAVLCDIGLPGLDGYGVVAALRCDPVTARTCAIALTGYATDADRRRAAEAGFDHHLTKPADIAVLRRLLSDLPTAPAGD